MRHTKVLDPYFANFQCIHLILAYEMNALVRAIDHYMQEISDVLRIRIINCTNFRLYPTGLWTRAMVATQLLLPVVSYKCHKGILGMLTLYCANAIEKGHDVIAGLKYNCRST